METTTTDIYREDIQIIDKHKAIPQEPRRDSLHRLLIAGSIAIEKAKESLKE